LAQAKQHESAACPCPHLVDAASSLLGAAWARRRCRPPWPSLSTWSMPSEIFLPATDLLRQRSYPPPCRSYPLPARQWHCCSPSFP
jgi:hypothetical protein